MCFCVPTDRMLCGVHCVCNLSLTKTPRFRGEERGGAALESVETRNIYNVNMYKENIARVLQWFVFCLFVCVDITESSIG